MWRNVVGKFVSGAEALCNIYSLLPSLQLSLVILLEEAVLLEVLIVVVVIEVQVAHFEETTRELAPGTLPFGVSCLAARSPEPCSGSNVESPYVSGVWPPDVLGTRWLSASH